MEDNSSKFSGLYYKQPGYIEAKRIQYYAHFCSRLYERYGIDDLSFREFNELHETIEFYLIYKLSSHKSFGSIMLRGKMILVIKNNYTTSFITCLLPHGYMPMPLLLRKRHVKIEEFQSIINQYISDAYFLYNHLVSINFDAKSFFVNKIRTDLPQSMYSAAFLLSHSDHRSKFYARIIRNIVLSFKGCDNE